MSAASLPISVVLPMRNASRWLPYSIAALTQDWDSGFELIAIDDGSSDDSAGSLERLCRHWPRDRWRLLDGGSRGVSNARNLGVAASRSQLIAFLDADDRPLPGRLGLPLQAMQERAELSHIHGAWWRCDARGRQQHLVQPWLEGASFDWRGFMEHKAVLPSAWTVRRSAFEAVGGFNPDLSHSEDVDLLLRLAASGHEGAWLNAPLVRYRVHEQSASSQVDKQIKGLLRVVDAHLNQASEPDSWLAKQRYDTTTWASWHAWHGGNEELALSLLSQALPSCTYPLARRAVHYLEVFQRSCDRIGVPFNRGNLLESHFWKQAQQQLEQR